ncbi:MAG: ribosome maturation factor RimM [Chloroflexota bacterium]|nr:ribosome maturation factor RimM [Chloroflexota bacterium]
MRDKPEPRYLIVGRVVRPHGIRGAIQVEILTDAPEHIAELETLYLGPHYRPYQLEQARFHKQRLLLQLKECTERDAAEALREYSVAIAIEDAVPLAEDEFYHFQLEGMAVQTDTGEELGELVEILSPPGANDVYIVHGLRGEVLLPAIPEVVREIDLEAGCMLVHLIPGLLADEE